MFVCLCLVRVSGPVLPCPFAEGSEQSAVVRLPEHVEVRFDGVRGDWLLVQRVGSHFVSGSRSCVLEPCELSAVVDGDDQLPGGEQHHADQQDTAHYSHKHRDGVRAARTLWLFKGSEDGLAAGVLRISKFHHTIVVCLIETKHSSGLVCFQGLHCDDLILAQTLAGLIVRQTAVVEETALDTFPFGPTGVRACGALLARVSESARLGALAATAHAVASAAAHLSVVRLAGAGLGGAVAVVADVSRVALALPAVALSVT